MEKPKILDRYERFCLYYLETGDRKEAYHKVYGTEMKDHSAVVNSYKILARKDVQAYMNYLIRSRLDEVQVSLNATRILEELTKMALSPDHMYPAQKLSAIIEAIKLLGIEDGKVMEMIMKQKEIIDAKQTKQTKSTKENKLTKSTKSTESTK